MDITVNKNSIQIIPVNIITLYSLKFLCNHVCLDSSRINHPILYGEYMKNATFKCPSKTKTFWYSGNDYMIYGVNEELLLHPLDFSDSGYYRCRGTNEEGKIFWSRGKLIVISNTKKHDVIICTYMGDNLCNLLLTLGVYFTSIKKLLKTISLPHMLD